MNGEFLLA